MKHTWKLALLGLAVGLLAACSQPKPQEEEPAVVVPDTTKVLDAGSRNALSEVSPDGTLRFDPRSGVENRLKAGDVVVSEPAQAIPDGLLRKVRAVRVEGGAVLVETEPAKIQEAIHRGSLSVRRELKLEDLRSSVSLQQGVSVQGFRHTLNTDFGTGGRIRATGTLEINPVLDFDLGLRCDETVRVPLLGRICAEWPDLEVLARVGVEQSANLRLTGELAYTFEREWPIATHNFAPLTFFIGPVPVVLTPKLTIFLRADGEVTARFNFEVQQSLTLIAGFEYNSDRGFRDLSEHRATLELQPPTLEGRVLAQATAGVRFQVLLYGVVGPYGELRGGPKFEASLQGLSGGVLWHLRACLTLSIGITSVEILDLRYNKDLLQACLPISQRTNTPPTVSIQSPTAGSEIYRGVAVTLRGLVSDVDAALGQGVSCRWTSSIPSDPSPTGCEASATFSTTGSRTLTLTATDTAGASRSASVTITVREPPAILVSISSPADGATLYFGENTNLSGSASGGTGPYTYTWRVAFPTNAAGEGGTVYTIGNGANRIWRPSDTIPGLSCSNMGYAKLTLEARDANSLMGSRSIIVYLTTLC
ncbi:Ig-like domain-containing protein [Meiothermus hypogaeus]|uniref:PKD domain-containing protein n=2 Tax=Meiothermus hypogaeus TaxID=884155 RepID=A0A511R0U5_9DEIN|nr:Ig-like domain-containing protein [Meiothermus hypogaeus]RIH78726.1 hypothetical protein Mhypo_01419 [Meiothermus hypogaeus]GEM83245.1 hypothetical protein MHY01S_14110 [Meiothermus hypogaeus NBRC 106114]